MKTNQGLTQSLMAITAIVGGLITASMTVAPARAATEIIPVDENAYGNTYGEWGRQPL